LSQQNVDIVRRWLVAPGSSSTELRAAISTFWEEDADYYPVRKFPDARPYHGAQAITNFFERFTEAFSQTRLEVRWAIPVHDDRVLACGNLQTEGRGSGIALEGDVYYCFWMRHGRFFRVQDHLTLKGALHALGFEAETLEGAGLSI
jgi:SnoaL-like domain